MKASAVAMMLIALIATACASEGRPAEIGTTPPLSTTASSSSSSTPVGSKASILGVEHDLAAPCIAGAPNIDASAVFWIGCNSTTGTSTAQIIEYPLPDGPARVVYQPSHVGSGISLLRVSTGWLTWVEYSDLREASDAKLFAMRRNGGTPIPLDDASAHQPLAGLMETTLDGDDAYWTRPLVNSGTWHGELVHRHLPDGDSTVIMQAPAGKVIGWVTARGGALAYELSSQAGSPQTTVVVQSRDGTMQRLTGPASEPSLGDGFVAFKAAERYATGDLAVFRLADGGIMTLGNGEAPMASGPFVTWKSSLPTDGALMLARPLSQCVQRLGDNPESRKSFPSLGDAMLAWVYRDPTRSALDSARVRYAALPSPDAPCAK